MNIKTTHSIGDLVYTADVYGIDRDVIKAVKILGVSEKIEYGIKSKRSGGYFSLFAWDGDGYNWYKPSQIFKSKEDAESLHQGLKAKQDAKEAEEKSKERKERLRKLNEERKALLAGEEYEDDSDYWED